MFGYIILWIVVVFIFFVISKYNWIIAIRNNRQNAFADIDVQLQQRFDLVPNLVNTVKWYASHEQVIFDKIMEARKAYSGAGSVDEKIAANWLLGWALWKLMAIVESNKRGSPHAPLCGGGAARTSVSAFPAAR